jgi:hypothetical protein
MASVVGFIDTVMNFRIPYNSTISDRVRNYNLSKKTDMNSGFNFLIPTNIFNTLCKYLDVNLGGRFV